jgi:flagellar assembly factor FliW
MPVINTKSLGLVSYEASSLIEFPEGLPGFEARRGFVAVQAEESAPLVFLQSVEEAGLCFITMPVLAIDAQYRLAMDSEDLARLGLPGDRQPRIGEEVLCLAVLSVRETGPTANLLAPLVVNISNRTAVQAVMGGSSYALQHVLLQEEVPAC